MFDFCVGHPEMLRLVNRAGWSPAGAEWHGRAGQEALWTRLGTLAEGQAAGVLDNVFEPIDNLLLLVHLSMGEHFAGDLRGVRVGRQASVAGIASRRLGPES